MLAAYFAALMDTGEKSIGAIILFMTAGFGMIESMCLIKVKRQEVGGYDEGHAGGRQKTDGSCVSVKEKDTKGVSIHTYWCRGGTLSIENPGKTPSAAESFRNKIC
jgi:hypothetical protein